MPKPNTPITFTAEIELQAAGEGKKIPTFSMLAYSGGLLHKLRGWEHPAVVNLAGLKIPSQKLPVRLSHDPDQGVGHTTRIHVSNGQLFAEGVISRETEFARDVVGSARNGFPWKASIGADPLETIFVPGNKQIKANGRVFDGPLYYVPDAKLVEISFVCAAADENSKAAVAASQSQKGIDMPPTNTATPPTLPELRAAAAKYDELLPTEEINNLLLASAEAGDDIGKFENSIINKIKLQMLRASRPNVPMISGRAACKEGTDTNRILAAATLMMYGQQVVAEKSFTEHELQAAQDLRTSNMCSLASAALQLAGRDVPTGGPHEIIRASWSTSGITEALRLSTERVLVQAYNLVPSDWREIAAVKTARNFKVHSSLKGILKRGIYQPIGPDGEIKNAVLDADSRLEYQVGTRGLMFSITREDLYNDDLDVILDLLKTLGVNGQRTFNKSFWQMVEAGVGTFFSTENGNFQAGNSTALGVDAMTIAVEKLRKQVDEEGNPIGVSPKCLVVPPSLEFIARQILSSGEVYGGEGEGDKLLPNGNPFAKMGLKVFVEPLLTDDKRWYLCGEPQIIPTFLVGFLNGVQEPKVETQDADFTSLGMRCRAYFDYGVALGDFRGAVCMAGQTL